MSRAGDPEAVRAVLAALAGPDFAVSVSRPAQGEAWLHPDERRAIAGASPARRADYATARGCARSALAQLGAAPGPILMGPDRAPCWPKGFVGSIAHGGGLCAAVAAPERAAAGVGIDIETATPLPSELEPCLCTDAERRRLDRTEADRLTEAKLLFAAKEALFKCRTLRNGVRPDFEAVSVRLDPAAARFEPEEGGPIAGRFVVAAGLVIALAVWRRQPARSTNTLPLKA